MSVCFFKAHYLAQMQQQQQMQQYMSQMRFAGGFPMMPPANAAMAQQAYEQALVAMQAGMAPANFGECVWWLLRMYHILPLTGDTNVHYRIDVVVHSAKNVFSSRYFFYSRALLFFEVVSMTVDYVILATTESSIFHSHSNS